MTVYLIRHGKTQGNVEHRYIGRTDQPLCPQGRAELQSKIGPEADRVLASPLLRCRETAAILYPGRDVEIVDDLRETDFGDFENRTYGELKDDPRYRAWLDSAGTAAPPGGESKAHQQARTVRAFRDVVAVCRGDERVALVVHGGTIMCLLEALEPSRRFYDWQAPNGGGYACAWDGARLTVTATI